MAKVSLRAYNREIEAMIDRNHLDEAIAHCRHILKSFPKHLETYRLLGKAYLEYKRYPEAVDIFSRVLAAAPDDFVAHVGMSIIRDEENRLDDAIWHMERAFETQPSNGAIQAELQRLYGRREGVQLPRIRMTHGALAHMYVKGELYPQAIAEIKNVLKEDPGRKEMQVLLARAYYRSGARNDAAEAASAILRTDPYCLDANRILVEILGSDRNESVQAYRQRVVELDPYASQVSGSIFLSEEVPDVAITLEQLDWNGQPVSLQPEWETRQAIAPQSRQPAPQEPDWLIDAAGEASAVPEPAPFDAAPPSAPPAAPADDIPDFLRAAGWGQATGAFDESQSSVTESESTEGQEAIAPGELPDWVKAMAPEQPAEAPSEEEELPDWISKIDPSVLPSASEAGDQPSESPPDWLSQPAASQETTAPAEEQPDWLRGFEAETAASKPSTGELDWLSHLGEESGTAEEAPTSESDFLAQPEAGAAAEPDFLKELESQPEPAPASAAETEGIGFLDELSAEAGPPAAVSEPMVPEPSAVDTPGTSSEEQDDTFAWLEGLAARQGATEGLLTKPEERPAEEPEWVRQAREQEAAPTPVAAEPATGTEELGRSEQDDLTWLESLAAEQGTAEPQERPAEVPEWIQEAERPGEQPHEESAAEETTAPEPEPAASLEELGRSEQEQEDSFAWLESLAARQGATEGLLTEPEERPAEEPEWIKQAKDVSTEPGLVSEVPSADDTAAWLRSLDEEDVLPSPEPTSSKDDTAMWFKNLEEAQREVPAEPAAEAEDLPAWMQDIVEETAPEAEASLRAGDMAAVTPDVEETATSEWMSAIDQESAMETRAAPAEQPAQEPAEEVPAWLSDLERDEEQLATPTGIDSDLPAWLRDETGEVVAEPTRIEPTRPTDWQRLEEEAAQAEPAVAREDRLPEPEAIPPAPQPEPVMEQPEAPTLEPEPVVEQPEAAAPVPEPAEVVSIIEEKIASVQEQEPAPVPSPGAPKRKPAGKPSLPFDPLLGQARSELSGSNVSTALESYSRLIKKGRFLDEVIHDLRDALYRFPVDVNIWQSLGDAYMRANRLQDALDAYTKAEELLR